ncbi:pleckstrin homology domain-containing family S member 1-like isoform X3 [Mobula hypostoma]|uniref:pleckstrin homology domain-containing family S member 1-like isoform X3 n=1 Tax=Mobula hypostoma TaxID=723540 RepID=UPI002FC34C34
MNKKGSSAFYVGNDIKEDDICYEDYLIKSPPMNQFATQSSWKKRYFILAKSKEEHVLSYFKNKEVSRKSPPLGKIPIRDIKEFCIRPDYHPKWNTLQKLFKCSSENVMLVQTEEREYFLIGEGVSLELLHQVIASVLQMCESQIQPTPEPASREKLRSYSLPTSEPPSHYDVPRKIVTANWRNNKVVSADSGIYESMSTIKAWHDSVSSISSLGSSDESNYLNLKAIDDAFPGGSLDEHCYQSPLEESNKGKQSTKEALEALISKITEETKLLKLNVAVCQQDFKTNLSLLEVQNKVCVAYSDEKCALKHGDQIVAINKLQIQNVEELQMLLNKSMEEEVLATILRMPDAPSDHNKNKENLRKELMKVVQSANLHKEPPTSSSP